jgi:hypothetical protein
MRLHEHSLSKVDPFMQFGDFLPQCVHICQQLRVMAWLVVASQPISQSLSNGAD